MKLINTSKKKENLFLDLNKYLSNLKTSNDDYEILLEHSKNSNPVLNLLKETQNNTNQPKYKSFQKENSNLFGVNYIPNKRVESLENIIGFEQSYKIQIPQTSRLRYYR